MVFDGTGSTNVGGISKFNSFLAQARQIIEELDKRGHFDSANSVRIGVLVYGDDSNGNSDFRSSYIRLDLTDNKGDLLSATGIGIYGATPSGS